MSANDVVVIGLSGASSAGKTTLSLVLSQIFKPWTSVIVEETDFIVSKSACPVGFYFDTEYSAIRPAYDVDCWNAVDVHRRKSRTSVYESLSVCS
jgi:uridine kinase